MYIYKNQRFKPDENSDIKLLFDKNKNMRWFVDDFNEIKNYNLSVMDGQTYILPHICSFKLVHLHETLLTF